MDNVKNILMAGEIYNDICNASEFGNKQGMNVGKLKAKYNIRKRDIEVLLKFMIKYFYKSKITDISIYCFTIDKADADFYSNIPYLELEENEIEELDISIEGFEKNVTDSHYIWINDEIQILREKIKSEDLNIDVCNATMLSELKGNLANLWNKIAETNLDGGNVIIKGDGSSEIEKRKKDNWVSSVLKKNIVKCNMEYDTSIKSKTVYPLGLYYDKFLKTYFCVYKDTEGNIVHTELKYFSDIIILEEKFTYNEFFSVYDYIKKIQNEKMVIKVYKEAKVAEKLKKLLDENELSIQEYEGYYIFTFMVYEPIDYIEILNEYGRSVIIIEPKSVNKMVLESINTALTYYV